MAGGTRKREMTVSSSWRMVEGGENDSFDTSVLPDDEDFIISSGSDPSQFTSSQPLSFGGSQPFSINGSQDDNIEDFLRKAENDDHVIMSTPFRPSVPQSVRHLSRQAMRQRSPEPEFVMPKVEVESPRRYSNQSSRTIRATPPALPGLRHRQQYQYTDSPTKLVPQQQAMKDDGGQHMSSVGQLCEALPGALFNVLSWFFGLFGLAIRYAYKPLAILLSIYLVFGGVIVVQNMATKSVYNSLSPLCYIPWASSTLPFCPEPTSKVGKGSKRTPQPPVEFETLMNVQEKFEGVLEKSADGVSLPLEMKRAEASVRDLRTMVGHSTLEEKGELVAEFDGYIDVARKASNDLQKFNTHVGSAVDSVISINRWTSRYLDGLAHDEANRGLISDWTSWLFSPFQPAVFTERHLLDKYIEHTALVSDKIADLILEAQEVLRTLTKADDHLQIIHNFVTRTQNVVQSKKDEILSTLWSLIGGNKGRIHNLDSQLLLLRQVGAQRLKAVQQVSDLVTELVKIQESLADLRDRVAEPELVRGKIDIPLSIHVETINRGVERLETARGRIRDIENERIAEVLARGKGQENLIEPS
ncbi:hypothetical protein V8F20_000423 [Naviculisporaceae sp. PSN 640]